MEKKLLFYILVISIPLFGAGQWKLIREVELSKKPHVLTNDNQGNIYIGFQDGSLVKYNSQGKETLNYSLSNQSQITLIEPQFQLKTFLFYFDNQLITILDRFKGVPKNYPIRDYTPGIVSMACPAPDGTIWLVENNPSILKRIDPNTKNIIVETQPILNGIRFMKAYQNILLILDENGLLIFDQFGGSLSYLEVHSYHLTVEKDIVYLLSGNEILTINPFAGEILSQTAKPEIETNQMIFLNDCVSFIQGSTLKQYQKDN